MEFTISSAYKIFKFRYLHAMHAKHILFINMTV